MSNVLKISLLLMTLGVYLMNKKAINNTVSGWALSARSETKMLGVHNDLKRVVRRALELSPYDFAITCGTRTLKEQQALYPKASNCDGIKKRSKHQDGLAIDFMAFDENSKGTWKMEYYEAIADAFKQAAKELDIPITWGGDWSSLVDGPHIELKG